LLFSEPSGFNSSTWRIYAYKSRQYENITCTVLLSQGQGIRYLVAGVPFGVKWATAWSSACSETEQNLRKSHMRVTLPVLLSVYLLTFTTFGFLNSKDQGI
jgi:hypothetical protein